MPRKPDPNARNALVGAARKEFALHGLHGARIEDITSACGLSKGSFYLHFDSKESLFGALVKQFEKGMDESDRARRKLSELFLRERPLTRADISRRSPRYRELLALEQEEDLRVLELLWEYRDIVEVLISGAQGTPFEGLVWKLVERAAARVADELRLQQRDGTCRTDVPPEIPGAMMAGTYLLLAHRLCRMREKPDLRGWAASLQTLLRQGTSVNRIARRDIFSPRGARKPARPSKIQTSI